MYSSCSRSSASVAESSLSTRFSCDSVSIGIQMIAIAPTIAFSFALPFEFAFEFRSCFVAAATMESTRRRIFVHNRTKVAAYEDAAELGVIAQRFITRRLNSILIWPLMIHSTRCDSTPLGSALGVDCSDESRPSQQIKLNRFNLSRLDLNCFIVLGPFGLWSAHN